MLYPAGRPNPGSRVPKLRLRNPTARCDARPPMERMAEQNPLPASDSLETAAGWLAGHGRVALATVIATWGSSPVPVGGQMVVAPDESFAGSVSGGCVEADVIAEAGDVLAGGEARTLEFGVADETAWEAGLPCGGSIRVHVERLTRERDGAMLDRLLAARRSRRPVAVVTPLGGGEREVIEMPNASPPEIAEAFAARQSRLITSPAGERFVQVLTPPPRMIVVGATHIAQVLVSLARIAGYEMIVVDPRTAFASPARFGATPIVAEWPEDAFGKLALDDQTAVVVVAHVARIDDEALISALRTGCRYVGALGSRRNQARRAERLAAAGIAPEEIARIRAPIGLDIGARTPPEIALSIMAELVQAFRGQRRQGASR